MTATHATQCLCGECARLDKLRWQGIPGASQLALIDAPHAAQTTPRPPVRFDAGTDGLPLFAAPQPQLF